MRPLFIISELEKYNYKDQLPLECEECSETFYVQARLIKSTIKRKLNNCRFCSLKCANRSVNDSKNKNLQIECKQCGKLLNRAKSIINQSKSGNQFCSQSCSAKYNNTHKTTGTRRSKLEIWLQQELTNRFPNLNILYNNKETINSELDIYIPSLKLAVELNGIFHYEPIYGEDKLSSIINNDNRKFQACLEQKIELVIIDVSNLKNFKIQKAQKYLDIILSIINRK